MTTSEHDIEIDAAIIAEGFALDPESVPELLRARAITSRTYRGIGDDEGTWQLVFFHGNARLTVVVDSAGNPLRRSVVDFGSEPLPMTMRISPSARR